MLDNKEKAFLDLHKYIKTYIPSSDKIAIKQVEDIMSNKIL